MWLISRFWVFQSNENNHETSTQRAVLWVLICMVQLIVCYYTVKYTFQSQSTLYSCLNVTELLSLNRCDFWSLIDSSEIRTHNHLARKWTLNRLAKLAKWLSCIVLICTVHLSMLLSCHKHISVWIYTL